MIKRSFSDCSETLKGEALLLSLAGRIIYSYPDDTKKAWYQSLIQEEVFTEVPFAPNQGDIIIGLHFLQSWSQSGFASQIYSDMQKEYTRLFIRPGKDIVSQWESTYFNEDRLTFREQTLDVRAWYRRYDLIPEKLYREPDDHIGLELIFTAHMAQLAVQALEKRDEASFEELIQAQKGFLSEHLLRWGPTWCNLVEKNTRMDFYRGIACILRGALTELSSIYDLKIPVVNTQ